MSESLSGMATLGQSSVLLGTYGDVIEGQWGSVGEGGPVESGLVLEAGSREERVSPLAQAMSRDLLSCLSATGLAPLKS